MQEYHTRWSWIVSIAMGLTLMMGFCVYVLCYSLGLSSNAAFFLAAITAILTFVLVYYLANKYIPHYRIATIYDDPEPGARIVDENGEEVSVPRSAELESTDTSARPGIDESFMETIEFIEKEFNPRIAHDEAELESKLFALLSGKYPDSIKKDVDAPDGKIDLVVNDVYGIELRAVDNEESLRNLIGDIAFYADRYKNTAVVLFIDRLLIPGIDLERYVEKLDHYGAAVIVKQGMVGKGKER